jgi:predicted transcriptional regulator
MLAITDYINNDFKAIKSSDSIESIMDFFEESRFSHFPVVEEGVYIGCISSEEVETYDSSKKISDYSYSLKGFYVRTNLFWIDVLEVFSRNNTTVIPVLDEENNYVGYYEITEVIRNFYDTPFVKDFGGVIIVEKSILDFTMSQVVQIVESNGGKILGLYVSNTTSDKVQVTIKIVLGGMNEILQSFRRYEFDIISEHKEDIFLNDLKDRSAYLDKYLNI